MLNSEILGNPKTEKVIFRGSLIRINKAGEELLGYSRDELLVKNDYDFFPLAQADFFIKKDREVLRNGKLVEIREEEIDTRLKGKRTLHTKKIPILNSKGSPQFLLWISEDITERKQSDEKNLRLATIVDSSDDAIIGKTLDGIITSWNKGAERIYGYKEHEVIGKSIFILAPHDREEEIQGFLEQIRSGEAVKHIETVRRNKVGDNIDVSLTISPIIDKDGSIIGASTIARDISDRVKAAQDRQALQSQFFQAQKMEAVGILAGGVAHDFNNLLQSVIGYSELLLQRKKPGDPEFEDIQRIYDSGQRGADLVKSLLMFSRKVQPELRPIDLNHEIAQVRKLLSHSIAKTIKIDLRLSDILERVLADPSQTGQVIMNLAINARDAMPDGGTLTIETANVELDKAYCAIDPELSPGSYVLLAVSDTGQGMDKETLSHIFEPFFTTKEPGKGTGLGLATVYGIVKQHGGHITCYSEPGLGTTFRIYFPTIEKEIHSESSTTERPIPGGTETILLADDEEVIRGFGTRFLNQFGYRVITANDGKEALEIEGV
jgi:PAS domain S-box-containing protein